MGGLSLQPQPDRPPAPAGQQQTIAKQASAIDFQQAEGWTLDGRGNAPTWTAKASPTKATTRAASSEVVRRPGNRTERNCKRPRVANKRPYGRLPCLVLRT